MPAATGGGDIVRHEQEFTPSVAGTVGEHSTASGAAAAAVGFPEAPEGLDPLSAAIVARMASWPAEREAVLAFTAQKNQRLGTAASATTINLQTGDADNASSFDGIGN